MPPKRTNAIAAVRCSPSTVPEPRYAAGSRAERGREVETPTCGERLHSPPASGCDREEHPFASLLPEDLRTSSAAVAAG